MRNVSLISAKTEKDLNQKYQNWINEHPFINMKDVEVYCTSVHKNTGSYPGDSEHTIFLFYESP